MPAKQIKEKLKKLNKKYGIVKKIKKYGPAVGAAALAIAGAAASGYMASKHIKSTMPSTSTRNIQSESVSARPTGSNQFFGVKRENLGSAFNPEKFSSSMSKQLTQSGVKPRPPTRVHKPKYPMQPSLIPKHRQPRKSPPAVISKPLRKPVSAATRYVMGRMGKHGVRGSQIKVNGKTSNKGWW